MHVGTGIIFQNPLNEHSDVEVYKRELALAYLVEPLGFDSIWGVEHHFTDYTMSPDVLQFLTYMVGRTRTVRLGSMVVVLPWHDPIRVAEQAAGRRPRSSGPPPCPGAHRRGARRVGLLGRGDLASPRRARLRRENSRHERPVESP